MAADAPRVAPSVTPAPSAAASVLGSSSAPSRAAGRIVCGHQSCRVGEEVCCEAAKPEESTCVRTTPAQLREWPTLDALCDARQSLLIACNESGSCGGDRVCCETICGGEQNEPVVCVEPRAGERFPCAAARPALRCGSAVCEGELECCIDRAKGDLACATDEQCLARGGAPTDCGTPSDCAEGEFCGKAYGGGGCDHAWDGATEILCGTAVDCPPSFRAQCEGMQKKIACSARAPDDQDPWLRGRRTCRCEGP